MQPIQFYVALRTVKFSCISYWRTNYDTVRMWITQTSDSSGFLLHAFTFIYNVFLTDLADTVINSAMATGRYLIYVSMRHYVLTTTGDIVVCFHMAVCLSC